MGLSAGPGSWKKMGTIGQTKEVLSSITVTLLKGFIWSFMTLKLVWLSICSDFFLLKLIHIVRKGKKTYRQLCKYNRISPVNINLMFSKTLFCH